MTQCDWCEKMFGIKRGKSIACGNCEFKPKEPEPILKPEVKQ